MRTDVKYGVIIAVCVVLLTGASLYVLRGDSDAESVVTGDGTGGPEIVNVVPAGEASDGVTPLPSAADAAAQTPDPDMIVAGYPDAPAVDENTYEVSSAGVAAPESGLDVASARLPTPGAGDTGYSVAAETPAAPFGEATTYKVRQGDTYWDIAVREYGDGTLFKSIQDANPTVGASKLRPGMTISIPPRPAPSVAAVAAGTSSVGEGTIGIDEVTGKQYYIVKKGDKGFWDIAKVVYKAGKHYKLIEQANPDLNSRSLRPGKKVWVPVRSFEVAVAAVAVGSSTPAAPRPSGPVSLMASVRVRTGAPTRVKLSNGQWFD